MTLTTRDGERNDNPVTALHVFHFPADFNHLAHELVAENVARFHGRNIAIIKMKVRSTDRGTRDPDYRITRVENLGIIDGLDTHLFFSLPTKRLHNASLLNTVLS